jgi:hypothetical protein
MALRIGSTSIGKVYKGATPITKIYKGATLLYSSGTAYEAETTALLARMDVQPSAALAALINTTILSLKTSGTWEKLDALYFRNVHTSQVACLNWISTLYNSTLVNSPTFIEKTGVLIETAKYIDTGFRQINGVTKMQSPDMAFGIALTTPNSIMYGRFSGFRQNGYPRMEFEHRPASYVIGTLNSNTIQTPFNCIDNNDYVVNSRSADFYNTMYKNGTGYSPVLSPNDYPGTQPTTILEGCYRYVGTPSNYINGIVGFSHYGSRLIEADVVALNNAWINFYTNVGGTF